MGDIFYFVGRVTKIPDKEENEDENEDEDEDEQEPEEPEEEKELLLPIQKDRSISTYLRSLLYSHGITGNPKNLCTGPHVFLSDSQSSIV